MLLRAETPCTSCIHRSLCVFKEELYAWLAARPTDEEFVITKTASEKHVSLTFECRHKRTDPF